MEKSHDKGYGPSKSRIQPTDGMQKRVKYITRYMKHPVISDSRIVGFDGDTVRFWYDEPLPNGKKKRVFVTMDALEFLHNVLCHIHEKHFRSAVPYGLYSINNKLSFVSTTVQMRLNIYDGGPVLLSPEADFHERLGRCPRCHEPLYVVAYVFLDKKEYSYKIRGYYPALYPSSTPDLTNDEISFPDDLLNIMTLLDLPCYKPKIIQKHLTEISGQIST